jgi:hypothetical protein
MLMEIESHDEAKLVLEKVKALSRELESCIIHREKEKLYR